MKKKLVMTLLTLSMALGACGTTAGTSGAATEASEETDPLTDTDTAGETFTYAPDVIKGIWEVDTDTAEEMLAYAGSGKSENLTEGLQTIDAVDSEFTEAQEAALSKASMQLFANAVAQEGKRSNVLLSPVSIAQAFGMTGNGAKGETLAQMEQVIGGGLTIDEMNPLMHGMAERFENAQDVDWNVANSIWFKDDGTWQVKEDFAKKALSWYGADIWKAPFDQSTVNDINSWVSEQTRGMIPEILDSISRESRMYLINAMAFEGEWMDEYLETQILEDLQFVNADGSTTDVTMLASKEDRYFTLGNGIGFVRDYKGGEYSFMGLLPEEGTDLDAYIADLAAQDADLAAAIRGCSYGDVFVRIPEFSFDYEIEMSDMLKAMGMDFAFDRGRADFSDMMEPVDANGFQIWIGGVIHKTHIEVDRVGTRAAAVTMIDMRATNSLEPVEQPLCIYLERPFIYGIIDNETGLPVFLGCVNAL